MVTVILAFGNWVLQRAIRPSLITITHIVSRIIAHVNQHSGREVMIQS